MSVRDRRGSNIRVAFGSSSPLSVGDQVYDFDQNIDAPVSISNFTAETPMVMFNNGSLFNISYKITIFSNSTLYNRNSVFNLSSFRVKISVEGIYDDRTGTLCMIGCRDLNLMAGTPLAGWNTVSWLCGL